MLPQPRPRLKNVPYKNQSLQDILLTCAVGVEVLDIKRVAGDKYNTRLVIIIDKGKLHPPEDRFEKRVQFYNRLKLEKILPLNYKPLATVEDTVHELNVFHKHDFNNDDLEIINGKLEAKRTSLGYYSNRIGDDLNLMWDANDSKVLWSPYETDFMWAKSDQFPSNEAMVGDAVTEREFKQGFVAMMKAIIDKVDKNQLGKPEGVATLDSNGKVRAEQIPTTIYFNEPNW